MFELLAKDSKTQARCGQVIAAHGSFATPALLPVGTLGSVKGILPGQLRELGVQAILANTYHLHLRPGENVIRQLGGLHAFMGWDGPIVTDSGGFQIFSLAQMRKIDDAGVTFRSHIDGAEIRLTAEKAIDIQVALGSDIMMPLDICPSLPAEHKELNLAVERTLLWAARAKQHYQAKQQLLFGIVQGGPDEQLRAECAKQLVAMNFAGYAIGGVAVGEGKDMMHKAVAYSVPHLPENKARYLMGVGNPEDLLMAVEQGVDFFDCVAPTRNARNALVYTSTGKLKLRNSAWTNDAKPLDEACDCLTCLKFSRAYLRHLFQTEEMLGPILATIHNLRFFMRFMADMRTAIAKNQFTSFKTNWQKIYA